MFEGILGTLAGLATVFGWAFFSFWSAIPAGIALRLSPLLVAITVTLSYGAGVVLVVIAGTPIRERIQRRMAERGTPLKIVDGGEEIERDESRVLNRMLQTVQRGWNQYGLLGLSVLSPMTVGAQVGAVIGLSLGVSPLRLTVAMTLGAALWAVIITVAVVAGVLTVSQAV